MVSLLMSMTKDSTISLLMKLIIFKEETTWRQKTRKGKMKKNQRRKEVRKKWGKEKRKKENDKEKQPRD